MVAGQTIAWAVGVVGMRFVFHRPHGLLGAASVGSALAILCGVGLVAGLVTYAGGSKILTWASFQAAGLLAWLGYLLSGEGSCFSAGVVALLLMHALGPGR